MISGRTYPFLPGSVALRARVQTAPYCARRGAETFRSALSARGVVIVESQAGDTMCSLLAATPLAAPDLDGGWRRSFDAPIKVLLVEDLIQARVEWVGGTARQVLGGDPHRRLLHVPFSFAHRHARQCRTRDRSCRSKCDPFITRTIDSWSLVANSSTKETILSCRC